MNNRVNYTKCEDDLRVRLPRICRSEANADQISEIRSPNSLSLPYQSPPAPEPELPEADLTKSLNGCYSDEDLVALVTLKTPACVCLHHRRLICSVSIRRHHRLLRDVATGLLSLCASRDSDEVMFDSNHISYIWFGSCNVAGVLLFASVATSALFGVFFVWTI
ncbi:hypothetical protein TIFTF001_028677 [Ficus carica]|uniref:Uncharacterized protein n=1 Tax=Ficus carica TaxID=3494 RepID=A0AA88DQB5_FICCA|nr:hypothetical protein TIFTF001_028677 [Ficus carica]